MGEGSSSERPLGAAAKALGRRPLTVRELTDHLRRRGFDEAAVEEAVAALSADGHLDDAALAEHYLEARAGRLLHGPARMVRELVDRGVDEAVARRAWQALIDDGRVDPRDLLRRALERRLPAGAEPADRKAVRRVYNALLRAGFEASEVMTALFPHSSAGGVSDEE